MYLEQLYQLVHDLRERVGLDPEVVLRSGRKDYPFPDQFSHSECRVAVNLRSVLTQIEEETEAEIRTRYAMLGPVGIAQAEAPRCPAKSVFLLTDSAPAPSRLGFAPVKQRPHSGAAKAATMPSPGRFLTQFEVRMILTFLLSSPLRLLSHSVTNEVWRKRISRLLK